MIRINIRFLFFRNDISFKTTSGEMSAVTEQMAAPWNETTLPTLLSNHKLENVFNADKFGLPYQCLPTKTYHPPGEKCSGAKNSKAPLTGMAAARAFREQLPVFVVGRSKTLRCFKNIKQLPCQYRSLRQASRSLIIQFLWE